MPQTTQRFFEARTESVGRAQSFRGSTTTPPLHARYRLAWRFCARELTGGNGEFG